MKVPMKLIAGVVLTGAVAIVACSKKSDDAAATATYSYAGPGSHYTVTNTSGTYSIKKYTLPTSTSPDFTVTASTTDTYGFKKLTVTAVTGSGGPTAGAIAYGLEVPGFALFIQPLSTSAPDQVITAVAAGTCPTTTMSANWVTVKKSSGSNMASVSQDAFGTFQYTTAGVASLPAKYSLANPTTTLGSNTFTAATCSNGIMTVSNGGGDTAAMYLTSGGGAIVNTGINTEANASYIFGMPAATLTGTTFTGTYSGLVYMGSQSSGSKLKPIKFTLTGTSTGISGTGYQLTDPSTDTTSANQATLTITALNSPSAGLMTGTLTTPGGTANLACMAVANASSTGKQMINCAGSDPSSTAELFNFLLVSR